MLKDENVYYNQLGTLKGRMILEGQNSTFNFSCVKEHFYGVYDYSKMNNHINLLIPSHDNLLNFQLLSEQNMTILEVGNYQKKSEGIRYINNAVYERQILKKGLPPVNLNILLKLSDDSEVGLHIKQIDKIEYKLQEQYNVYISVIEVLMEGKKYRGIMECGYNENEALWFNGTDI